MEKVIRDGKVAVLYSPGYGAGWSTWGGGVERIFHPPTVAWVEGGKVGPCPYLVVDPYGYMGGANDLEIEWLPIGTVFEIDEYDGSESIRVINYPDDFLVA